MDTWHLIVARLDKILHFVDRASCNDSWLITNGTHKFHSMYLFLCITLYMFRAHRAHHQERQIVLIKPLVTVNLCRWLCLVQVAPDWIGYILHRNCLPQHVAEGKTRRRIEVTGTQGKRRTQLLYYLKETYGCCKLKEEELDRLEVTFYFLQFTGHQRRIILVM